MKKYYILCLIAILSVSCEKGDNGGGSNPLYFIPRQVSYIFIVTGKQRPYSLGGYDMIDFQSFGGNSIPGNNLFFSIQTFNYDPRVAISQQYPDIDPTTFLSIYIIPSQENLDDHSPTIEQQIKLDYDMWMKKLKKNSGYSYVTFEQIEYRTTQIRNLTISTLDKPLFGKAAGESLNEFFDIRGYDPPVIVSAPTNTLVYGYSHSNSDYAYPTSIEEWLDLSPLAQANMFLVPNKKIDGLPMDVRFVVQMETAEGVVFSDTTRVLTLTE